MWTTRGPIEVSGERVREREEDLAERRGVLEGLRFVDVDLRRRKRRVSRGALDLDRVVAAHGAPRDACVTEVVPRERPPRLVVGEEFFAHG